MRSAAQHLHVVDSAVGGVRVRPKVAVWIGRIKEVPEVCSIFCATANPVEVIVAETGQRRGVLGVVDGESPKGIEDAPGMEWRHGLLRKIGYKR